MWLLKLEFNWKLTKWNKISMMQSCEYKPAWYRGGGKCIVVLFEMFVELGEETDDDDACCVDVSALKEFLCERVLPPNRKRRKSLGSNFKKIKFI